VIAALLAAVLAVYPSGQAVPETLLRVTIVFDRPQETARPGTVALRRENGSAIAHPFADPPLWSPDGARLTLLLDPSRQKLGLRRHERLGFVLRAGERVTLTVDGVPRRRYVPVPRRRVPPGAPARLPQARWPRSSLQS